jgi:hypothetical protein
MGVEGLQVPGIELTGLSGEDDLQGGGDKGMLGGLFGCRFAIQQAVGQLLELFVVGGKQRLEDGLSGFRGKPPCRSPDGTSRGDAAWPRRG